MCAEIAYASLALLALTVGPVFTLWRDAQLNNPALPIDSAHLATFVVVQLPALFLLGRRISIARGWVTAEWYLAALCIWLLITATLSDVGSYAVGNAVKVILAACTGLYLASSFSRQQQLLIVSVATHIGVFISRLAVARGWLDSLYESQEWSGIYVNPNLLGPVAAMACLSLLYLAAERFRDVPREWRVAFGVLIVDLVIFDLAVLVHTKAFTSVLSLVVALVVWISIFFAIRINAIEQSQKILTWAVRAFTTALIAAMVLLYKFSSLVNGKLIPRSVLQERIFAWDFSWTGFLARPWLGWGQGVAWSNQIFRRLDLYWTVSNIGHSHSAYFDVLLGGGLFAGLMLFAYLVVALIRMCKGGKPSQVDTFRVGLAFFCLSAALFEPFIVTNYFLWPILVMALAPNKQNF